MSVLRKLRGIFTDDACADQTKPTDQAVTNRFVAAREASQKRQREHQKRQERMEQNALTIQGMVSDISRKRNEVSNGRMD